MKVYMFISAVFTGVFLAAPLLHANEAALYPDPPPKDASFVRFLGFEADEIARFAGKHFKLKHEDQQAYLPVSASALDDIPAGAFYTVVKRPGGATSVIAEPPRGDATQVYLLVVNASEQALDLKLADGSVPVILDVASMTSRLRPVNPVKIGLGVFIANSSDLLARFDVALRRGQNLTFFVDDNGVRLIENRFGKNAE